MELWRDQCRDLMVDTVRGDKVSSRQRSAIRSRLTLPLEQRADLPIREDAHGKIIVTGLSETVISDYAEFDEYFR